MSLCPLDLTYYCRVFTDDRKDFFLIEFFDIYSKLAPNFNNIIIASDLNCNLLDNSTTANHLKDFISESSLFCVPYGATFHKNNCDSWLDVILLDNESKLVSFSKSDAPFIDGHDFLLCECLIKNSKQTGKTIVFRNMKTCDQASLGNSFLDLLKLDDDLIGTSDPNKLLDTLITQVLSTLDLHAPVQIRTIGRNSNPWFTKELKIKCKQRDAIYKRAKRSRDPNLLALYKSMRKELKHQFNQARGEYLKTALSNLPYGSSIWSKFKHLGSIKSNSSLPLKFFDPLELKQYYANIVRKHPPCDANFVDLLFIDG